MQYAKSYVEQRCKSSHESAVKQLQYVGSTVGVCRSKQCFWARDHRVGVGGVGVWGGGWGGGDVNVHCDCKVLLDFCTYVMPRYLGRGGGVGASARRGGGVGGWVGWGDGNVHCSCPAIFGCLFFFLCELQSAFSHEVSWKALIDRFIISAYSWTSAIVNSSHAIIGRKKGQWRNTVCQEKLPLIRHAINSTKHSKSSSKLNIAPTKI